MGKKHNPALIKFAGYIQKELVLRFKQYCLVREKEQSQVLEEAIASWLDKEGAD